MDHINVRFSIPTPLRLLSHLGAWLLIVAAALTPVACGASDSAEPSDSPAPAETGGQTESPAQDTSPAGVNPTIGEITTFAGSGDPGYEGDGGPAAAAKMFAPQGIVLDIQGNLYISADGKIRKVDSATGIITTVAGSEHAGLSGDDGPATSAMFSSNADGMAFDARGNLFVADRDNSRIRRIDAATGIITTAAGGAKITAETWKTRGEGGQATDAIVDGPRDVAVDREGNIIIAETHRIRKVDATTGIITTIAGDGLRDLTGDGGPATGARVAGPDGVAVDGGGNIYIADTENHRVRKVDAVTGVITTVAGIGKHGEEVGISPGWTQRFKPETGAGVSGDGGPADQAELSLPRGVVVGPRGDLYIADSGNLRVRMVDAATGIVSTVAAGGTALGPAQKGEGPISPQLSTLGGGPLRVRYTSIGEIEAIALNDQGVIFVADSRTNRVHAVLASYSR